MEAISKAQGWTNPQLKQVGSEWRIYSDGGNAFVLLDKAAPELMAVCKGAKERKEIDDNEPF